MSERSEVRSEVADTDTGERAAISGSKRAYYVPVKRFSGALGGVKGIYR